MKKKFHVIDDISQYPIDEELLEQLEEERKAKFSKVDIESSKSLQIYLIFQSDATELYKARSRMKYTNVDDDCSTDNEEEERLEELLDISDSERDSDEYDRGSEDSESEMEKSLPSRPSKKKRNF